MTMRTSIVGLTGSLRAHSTNRGVLHAIQEMLPENTHMEIFPVEDLPYYNMDLETNEPEGVRRFKEQLRQADGIFIVTPEFNGSIPGILKNALDWASRPYGASAMAGKPTALCGASTGSGGAQSAQIHLRHILGSFHRSLHPLVITNPIVSIANSGEKFDPYGSLQDEATRQQLHELLLALLACVQQRRSGCLV